MVNKRPTRPPRHWKSAGRNALDAFTRARHACEAATHDGSTNLAAMVGAGLAFYDAVQRYKATPLDSCFDPIRVEVESLAKATGTKDSLFVVDFLHKLDADQKAQPKKTRPTTSTAAPEASTPPTDQNPVRVAGPAEPDRLVQGDQPGGQTTSFDAPSHPADGSDQRHDSPPIAPEPGQK